MPVMARSRRCSLPTTSMASKKSKLEALAELKRARQGGGRQYKVCALFLPRPVIHPRFQDDEDVQIYDEVSEDKYKSIVRGRLQRDDFVVDDGVDGYMDNGMDDFEEAERYDSEEERDQRKKKSKSALRCTT